MTSKDIEKYAKEFLYIIMRNNDVKEIPAKGRTVEQLTNAIKGEKLFFLADIGNSVNEVDVSEILDVVGYIRFINFKRPKSYIRRGIQKRLNRDEVVGEKFLKK